MKLFHITPDKNLLGAPRTFVQWITEIIVITHVGLGSVIIAGGPKRFQSSAFEPLLDYSGDKIWLWGVVITASGILISMPSDFLNIIGLWVGMCWHMIWMSCFIVAVARSDTAAATTMPAYGGFALICAALLTSKVLEHMRA